jgi:DNA recombination protein RmuC
MLTLIAGIAAAFVGIGFGFWLKTSSSNAEKAQLAQRSTELANELGATRSALAQAQADAASRAGFESLAAERARIIAGLSTERDSLRSDLQAIASSESAGQARIKELEAELRGERQNLQEKLALLEHSKQALANQFEALAAEILDKKTRSFAEGSQKELGTLLTPLREQIKEFRDKVEQAQSDSKTGVTKLETLIGTLGGLNQQLSQEARNLTTALRGSAKAQGDWGEFVLRDLLEKAGLREGEQYSFQQKFTEVAGEDDGKRKASITDVIVNLPGGRHLIIDSKVSLNAYADSVNADGEEERKAAVKRHLVSVRGHVDELAQRRYHKLSPLETPDFVVMFVPVEPAFLEALREDENLWRYAYEKEVLLVGPTTLLFVIRIVDNLWQQEMQARNVQDVMNRGAELYDKFVGFVGDLETLGKYLHNADQSYGNAMKKLSQGRGNLVRQVEMLRELGVRTAKSLPQNLLDRAETEESGLSLAAAAEQGSEAEA